MKYPMKIHTQAVSGSFLVHVLALFPTDIHEPIAVALADIGIDCLLDFLAEDINDLIGELMIEDRSLNPKEKRMVKNIHEWLIWETQNRPGIDFSTLTMNDYDSYLSTKFNRAADIQPDMPYSSPVLSSVPNVMSPFVTNVKLDVKQYPIFNGDNVQWPKFKQGVLALAATHGLDDVFDPKFVVPHPNDPMYQLYNEKNKFVYSF